MLSEIPILIEGFSNNGEQNIPFHNIQFSLGNDDLKVDVSKGFLEYKSENLEGKITKLNKSSIKSIRRKKIDLFSNNETDFEIYKKIIFSEPKIFNLLSSKESYLEHLQLLALKCIILPNAKNKEFYLFKGKSLFGIAYKQLNGSNVAIINSNKEEEYIVKNIGDFDSFLDFVKTFETRYP